MKSLVDSLGSLDTSEQAAILHDLSDGEFADLFYDWPEWARSDQTEPSGDWITWLILAGRGWGKTRCGAEWVRQRVAAGAKRIALIGETAADVRDVMIEGESGLLAISPPWDMPVYIPSKRRITWPNGAMAFTYSGETPDQLRGPQHDSAWADEPAKWRYGDDAWSNLMLGLRLGNDPRVVATTTPRPTPLIKGMVADKKTHVTRGSTLDNLENLAPQFKEAVLSQYEGTRLGRQEIYAELLDDAPGALWAMRDIEKIRISRSPDSSELRRIVVAIDPAASVGEDSDETGIIVVGLGYDGLGYVLADVSGKYRPIEWAQTAIRAMTEWDADRIIAEVNQGGDMVEQTLRSIDSRIPYKGVRGAKGKYSRAEPVSAIYEQGKVRHCGLFATLEDQMCSFEPGTTSWSPDRMDALVYALTDLMIDIPQTIEIKKVLG
jgi:phage terminase large subunit-like protein